MAFAPAKKITVKNDNSDYIHLVLEERGFCAALYPGNRTRHAESKNVKDFYPLLKGASVVWIDYVVDDIKKDASGIAHGLGFPDLLVRNLLKNSRSGYSDLNTEMGLLLPAMRVEEFNVSLQPLLILMRKNVLVTLHTSETIRFFRVRRYAETLLKKFPEKNSNIDKLTMLLIRIIAENNARNFDYLQIIEENGDKLSQELSDANISRAMVGRKIYDMKHALILYLGGLWATVDALGSLRYGDAELLSDNQKILDGLIGLVNEVQAQIGLAEHLSDVLASGLEVLQSIYNNQLQLLNNRLALLVAYLTIIGTALLVPNTLATLLSNSMFDFGPRDTGWYLALLLVSTIAATALSWWGVKKAGLLPKGPDSTD